MWFISLGVRYGATLDLQDNQMQSQFICYNIYLEALTHVPIDIVLHT